MDSHHRPPAFITVALTTELLHLIRTNIIYYTKALLKAAYPHGRAAYMYQSFSPILIKENCCCRCRTRICDLWLMRPTSYQLLQPAIWQPIFTNRLQRKQFNKVIYIKINETKQVIIWRLGLNEEPLAMIRMVSFCYRRASVTLLAYCLFI